MDLQKEIMKFSPSCANALAFVLATVSVESAFAQVSQFRPIEVRGKVHIEVPAHWYIRDLDERRNISAAGESLIQNTGERNESVHVSALSVVSRPEPVGAIIRVSFVPIEELSQATLKREIQTNRARVLNEISSVFAADMNAVRKAGEKEGIQILGQEKIGIDEIGGLIAFTVTYRRTSAVGPSPFTVTQYHIPIGKEKILLSLSYRESDGRLFPIIFDRVKRSVSIR